MPQVPKSPGQTVNLRALPSARVAQRNPRAFGDDVGNALARTGEMLQQQELEAQSRANKAHAKDLDLQFNNELRDLLHNPETGYFTKKGKNAFQDRADVEDRIKELQQKYAAQAGNDSVRNAFADVATRRIESSLNSIITHAGRQFEVWQAETSEARAQQAFEDAVLNRLDPEKRDLHIRTGKSEIEETLTQQGMGEEVISAAKEEFAAKVHVGIIEQMLVDDLKGAKFYYREHEKEIDVTTRTKIEQTFKRMDTQAKADAKARLSEVRDAVGEAIYALDRGYVPPDIAEVKQAAAGTKYSEKLRNALSRVKQSREFASLPPSSRETVLSDLRAGKAKDIHDVKSLERLEKVNGELNTLLDNDPIAYAVEIGLGTNPPPLDLSNPEAFTQGLKQRRALALAVEEHSGMPVSPLSVADKPVIEQILSKASAGQKLQFFGKMTEAMGKDAALMAFNDMDGKIGGQYGLAGQLVTHGASAGAESILDGMEQRKANPKLVPKDADLLTELTPIYSMWSAQPQKAAQYVEAFKNAYASLANKAGVLEGDIDSDLVEQAMQQVTGGVIKLDNPGLGTGDSFILSPKPGVGTDEFEDWLEGIKPGQVEAAGGVFGLPPERVAKFINDGDVSLETLTRGRYLIQWDGRYLLDASGERPFVLEYGE